MLSALQRIKSRFEQQPVAFINFIDLGEDLFEFLDELNEGFDRDWNVTYLLPGENEPFVAEATNLQVNSHLVIVTPVRGSIDLSKAERIARQKNALVLYVLLDTTGLVGRYVSDRYIKYYLDLSEAIS